MRWPELILTILAVSPLAAQQTTVKGVTITGVQINYNPVISCTGTPGPPLFGCASTSTSDLAFLATAPFSSSLVGADPTTCSGDCQNSFKEDTTFPGHIAGTENITRLSDGSTVSNGG